MQQQEHLVASDASNAVDMTVISNIQPLSHFVGHSLVKLAVIGCSKNIQLYLAV